ncbi:hypothetical protein HOO65_050132 [Ceratocystis lukuohia]|uniref:Uncharacterized protein n=1 Tax=Ceratocystis lukuohia TaxID=2019550 RepID=A0ABR4MFF8_9PEZI
MATDIPESTSTTGAAISAAVVSNAAALRTSLLRTSFNLRKTPATNNSASGSSKQSKYAEKVRAAETEDLRNLPQHNSGIGCKPDDKVLQAKRADEDLRRKLQLGRKRGADVAVLGAESSDEEEGRSALGRSKRAKKATGKESKILELEAKTDEVVSADIGGVVSVALGAGLELKPPGVVENSGRSKKNKKKKKNKAAMEAT